MKRPSTPSQQQQNQRADALNKNKGTNGTNITNAKVHGNRGKQMDQERSKAGPALRTDHASKANAK